MNDLRVLVLGLDGATWDVIEPWTEAGYLPNLSKLMKTGYRGKLRSTLPYVTPLAWSTIYTGVNPGKHGLLGFRKRLPGTYDWVLNTSTDMVRPALWDLLGEKDMTSSILFLPFTFPAPEVKGSVIAGAFGPRRLESRSTHPPTLAGELKERFDESKMYALRQSPGVPLGEVAQRMVEGVHEQTAAMRFALKETQPDFAFVVWHDTDKAAHLLWHHTDLPCPDIGSPLYRVYEAVDEGIGQILEDVGGDPLVIVCSDHGTYPIRHRVNAHLWLRENGFLELKQSTRIAATSKAGSVWRRMPAPLKRMVPVKTRKKVQQKVRSTIIKQNALVEWSGTKVYPQPISSEAFFLNLQGREPGGIVTAAEADDVVGRLKQALVQIEAPDGTPLVGAALGKNELFHGPLTDRAPDVVADATLGTMFAPTGVGETEIYSVPEKPDLAAGQPGSVGYHQRDGIFLISGPGARAGSAGNAEVADITPTILRYLGVPVPKDVDGTAIEAAFERLADPGWADPVGMRVRDATAGLTADEEAEVSKHLQDLGYIE